MKRRTQENKETNQLINLKLISFINGIVSFEEMEIATVGFKTCGIGIPWFSVQRKLRSLPSAFNFQIDLWIEGGECHIEFAWS